MTSKVKLNAELTIGIVSFPLSSLSIHRARPNDDLTQGIDYYLGDDGKILDFPHKLGVSTFGWNSTDTRHDSHGVVDDSMLHHPCTQLQTLSVKTVLIHDYCVWLRYTGSTKKKQNNVPHFSICPQENGLTREEWFDIIYGNSEHSCQWLPCELKASGEHDLESNKFDDGCDKQDIEYLSVTAHFAVRALGLYCRLIFPNLSLHDKMMINGILTEVCLRKPISLQFLLRQLNPQFVRCILTILQREPCHSSSASTYRGIAINEIEDFLDPPSDEEGIDGAVDCSRKCLF
jgi:hypothetical protein